MVGRIERLSWEKLRLEMQELKITECLRRMKECFTEGLTPRRKGKEKSQKLINLLLLG